MCVSCCPLHDVLPINLCGQGAIEGTLNVVRQGYAAGVRKFVVTGSIGAVFNPSGGLTDPDWNPTTKEDALKPGAGNYIAYAGSKAFAERALWEWADAHTDVDVTVSK